MNFDGRALRRTALAAVAAAGLALAACGDEDDSTDASTTPATTAAPTAQAVPDRIRESGVVKVASDVSYPPLEYFESDGKTVTGFDHDLGQALGERLGVEFRFVNTSFDGIIPALKARRFDVVMSAMTDTKERQRVLDFVNYLKAGTSLVVKKGNPEGISSVEDLCGKTIAVQKGTTHLDVAKGASADCEKKGSEPIDIKSFPKDTDAMLQVRSGRAVADLTDSPVAAYSAERTPSLEVVDAPLYGAEPYGIGVLKDERELRDAIKSALQALMEDGTYRGLLDKYGMTSGALERPTINAGSS